MERFRDAHYIHTPTQGNIYTLTSLKLASGSTILLIASLKREILCFHYGENQSGGLVPTTKEVSFTYIPSGAEIISIDAFNKSLTKNEWVIGITIIKNSNDSSNLETFLNVYSQLEESNDFDIENIAQNCLNVKLDFTPYHLVHTYIINWTPANSHAKETAFLLSGSDNQVHIYQENSSDHAFKEISNSPQFPEFTKTPSPVVWLDFLHINNFQERLTVFGCECGYVKFFKIDTRTNKVVYNFMTRMGNYISQVRLYLENDKVPVPPKFKEIFPKKRNRRQKAKIEKPVVNMVVVNSLQPGMFFGDVLKYGLSDYKTLPRHDSTMTLTSCCILDIDFDGEKEIILGNSSQELMLLKYNKDETQWYLEEVRDMAAPILSLGHIDVTGDGIRELIVSSLKGVHILQHDPEYIQKILTDKIDSLTIPKIEKVKIK